MNDIVQLVKQAAVEAVEAGKPVQILYGTVTSADPLQITLDSQTVYPAGMLVLTRNVTDYEMDIEVSHETLESDDHTHAYQGVKKIKVCNGLVEGDVVALLRMQQGKRCLVLDRIQAIPELNGEWI